MPIDWRNTSPGDAMLALAVHAGAWLTMGCLLCLLWRVAQLGLPHLSWHFLTSDALNAGREGGIGPMLLATGGILAVAMLTVIPVGLGAAIWLSEYAGNARSWTRSVNLALDALAGTPSIVFGLFGSAFFCDYLHLGYCLLAGGLTLSCMVLPVLTRTAQNSMTALPSDWRLGAAALGMSRISLVLHVLLPAAMPGVLVGIMLGTGRALAETAALVFTSGYVDRMPTSLLDSGRALSVHIYDLSMNVAGGDQAAYATAFVLMGLIILINTATSILGHLWRHQVRHP